MPLSRFRFEIVGPQSPDEVGVRVLAEVLKELERAIREWARAAGPPVENEQAGEPLRLVGVEQGSDRLVLATPAQFTPGVATLSSAVAERDLDEIPRESHQALFDLATELAKENWGYRFLPDESLGVKEAEVGPWNPLAAPSAGHLVEGTTTILARCERVGGVRPRVMLRVPGRAEALFVDVDEDNARKLGSRLYQWVALRGEATWERETWALMRFRVSDVLPYQDLPPNVAFARVRSAAENRWDGVDALEFVREQRESHGEHP